MMRAGEAHARMAALPLMPPEMLSRGPLLILAPHPDDESLGCGGLIATAAARGTPPIVALISDGAGSHPNSRAYPPPRLTRLREDEMRQALRILGVPPKRLHTLGLPDTRVPEAGPDFDAAIARLAGLADRFGTSAIVATWPHDPHCDHGATARMGAALARHTGLPLWYYPVWGWLLDKEDILPIKTIFGMRLMIGSHLARKQAAIAAHASQYSGLIADDRDGFRLPSALLSVAGRPFEVFLQP